VDTDRLELFSDGVLAVAITLLMLDLHVPSAGVAARSRTNWPVSGRRSPSCLVSFFMIGIIWVNHHAVLHNVARVDQTAMFDSLLLLILVTAIPFSTAILARYLHRGSRDAHPAAAIDGLPVLGVALSFTALCAWAARRGLLHAGGPGRGAASSVRLSPLGRSRSRRRSVWRS